MRPRLIRASAGTGKTYELSTRVIGLLAKGELPERILATTFTRKAAGEISERIFSRLAEATLDPSKAEEVGISLEDPSFNSEKAADLLAKICERQSRLRICTLDSFFSVIAKSFSFELGLMPDWRMLNPEDELRTISEGVRRLCDGMAVSELAGLLARVNKGERRRSVHNSLQFAMRELYSVFTSSDPAAWEWLPFSRDSSATEIDLLVEQLHDLDPVQNASGKPDKRWLNARDKIGVSFEAKDWKKFFESTLIRQIQCSEPVYLKKDVPPSWLAVLEPLVAKAQNAVLNQIAAQNIAAKELLQVFGRHLQDQRAAQGALSFSDVKRFLEGGVLEGRLDDLYYRLDSTIHHLLFDEFQDTSLQEWQILSPFVAEVLSKADEEFTFFCVGDIKQAIYGWRGGVAEIFDRMQAGFPQIEEESREATRRCAPEVVSVVNSVFGFVKDVPDEIEKSVILRKWGERFVPHAAVHEEQVGYVCVESVADQEPFERAASEVAELVEAAPDVTVGILVRTNDSAIEFLEKLNEYGIHASGEGGSPLTDSILVGTILAFLRIIDNPGDEISKYRVELSPICSFLEQDKDWQRAVQQEGYGPVLLQIVSEIKPYCDEWERRRLDQLVELAFQYDPERSPRAKDFIDLVKTRKVEDPGASAVRVMTIHSSKGLEFDAVFLPDLDRKIVQYRRDMVMTYSETPLDPPTKVSRYVPAEYDLLHPTFSEMKAQQGERALTEALSVLYVGMTRARHGLYMFTEGNNVGEYNTFGGIVASALSLEETFELGESRWWKGAAKETEVPSVAKVAPPEISDTRHAHRLYLHRSATQLAREREGGLASLMELADPAQMQRGTLVHLLFQELEWIEGEGPSRAELQVVALQGGFSKELTDSALDLFYSGLDNDSLRALFDRESYQVGEIDRVDVSRELPFVVKSDETIINGKCDRVVFCRHGAELVSAEIIDFKTGALSDQHKEQVRIYMEAIGRLVNLPLESVTGKLVFVEQGVIEEVV